MNQEVQGGSVGNWESIFKAREVYNQVHHLSLAEALREESGEPQLLKEVFQRQ
jgi:hypothetical protein